VSIVAGVDLGGTAVNYTLISEKEQFLIEGLCEHPALSKQGPEICLRQIEDGLLTAAKRANVSLDDIVAVGLDTPGPASASGILSARGSTNFVHVDWAGFDIREGLARRLGKPVNYLNDGNAGALWGHFTLFGANSKETSVSVVIGTGLGGGIIIDGNVVKGRKGFGGEFPARQVLSRSAIAGALAISNRFAPSPPSRKRSFPIFCRAFRGTTSAKSIFRRQQNWCAGSRKKAIRYAAKFSACKRMHWDFSSTR
jgi:predicted NBD/HSP70 family sugar kinase